MSQGETSLGNAISSGGESYDSDLKWVYQTKKSTVEKCREKSLNRKGFWPLVLSMLYFKKLPPLIHPRNARGNCLPKNPLSSGQNLRPKSIFI